VTSDVKRAKVWRLSNSRPAGPEREVAVVLEPVDVALLFCPTKKLAMGELVKLVP